MRRFYSLLFLSLLCCTLNISAQSVDTETKIFYPDFKTLKIQVADDFLAPPIIHLNSNEQITITFDEIFDDVRYMQYRLIHCNADWQPSQLLDSEIVDGFNIANVNDYAFSSNTFIHYVNYLITIPNQDIKPLVSGNFLLQVFPENDPDDIILQARFCIDEAKVKISGETTSRTDLGYNDIYQQVNFKIDQKNYTIRDPYNDIIAVVEQNGRNDNKAIIAHPQRVLGSEIYYEHIPQLIFKAGNEFRRFETVRANYPGMNVDSTRYIDDSYNAYLKIDEPRANQSYYYDQTQYGRYMIDEYNSTDANLGADYIMTHFSLDLPYVMNADIYIDGELSNHNFSDENKMVYNYNTNLYEKTMRLKQGSYNYQYLAIPRNGNTIGDPTLVEGNYYETINEYVIKIYQRQPGSRADRLIGSYTIYSGK